MPEIGQVAAWLALGFLAALGGTILAELLNGQINTRYLFWGRQGNGEMYFSPERVQLLVFTAWAAYSYLQQASQTVGSGRLPDVPASTLGLLGASHGVYLGGKAYTMLWKK